MTSSLLKYCLSGFLFLVYAQSMAGNGKAFWTKMENSRVQINGPRVIEARNYLSYQLDISQLDSRLRQAPMESVDQKTAGLIVSIPMPDGSFADFQVFASQVMHPDLAARYPQIQTYGGQGITDPTAVAKLDVTPFGFHAMILSGTGTIFIDPFSLQDQDHYMVYYKRDFITNKDFACYAPTTEESLDLNRLPAPNPGVAKSVGAELKTYRLALAATGEYTAVFGGTVPGALAAMVTSVNRVTGVYERDLAIRLTLIPNTDTLIYTNAATDPYTNSDGGMMLGQNQTNVMALIGGANFDIGHVFSTGGGGIAGLGVVCYFTQKARGVTGSPSPVGDPFDIDYVAHEMGHQFGGNHTFNCEVGACQGNRSFTTAYEPGSGTTIMAYARICGNNNLQSNSDDIFHNISFNEIINYTTTGIGSNCPVITTTSNNPPVINPGANYIIPYLTPFRLTGNASDPDGDPLTYCWEQFDLGPAGTWNNPVGNAPIFRSFDPTVSPIRLFPKLINILNNNMAIGEIKPSYARIMHFKLTVRDNRLNGGGVTNTDTPVAVEVINTGQAFAITSPNVVGITWPTGGIATVNWDVGGSDLAPISTPLVNILLSIDGGQSFPYMLAQSVTNNGSFNVNVPSVLTTTARVMVEGNGNIFFDINDKDFAIGTVGIGENDQENGVFVGPNPVHGSCELIIEDANLLSVQGNTLEFFDVTGRFLKSEAVIQNRQTFDVSAWSTGIYFFKFYNDLGLVRTGKLVVQ